MGDVAATDEAQIFAFLEAKFAERNAALLAIKGYSITEIAGLHQTAQGAAKAQAASTYPQG
ncbi:MAG: hypothetical protein JKY00_07270 [Roseicyclus sp.]|nr:hypothetical protein [Roseicyclus sp.]